MRAFHYITSHDITLQRLVRLCRFTVEDLFKGRKQWVQGRQQKEGRILTYIKLPQTWMTIRNKGAQVITKKTLCICIKGLFSHKRACTPDFSVHPPLAQHVLVRLRRTSISLGVGDCSLGSKSSSALTCVKNNQVKKQDKISDNKERILIWFVQTRLISWQVLHYNSLSTL